MIRRKDVRKAMRRGRRRRTFDEMWALRREDGLWYTSRGGRWTRVVDAARKFVKERDVQRFAKRLGVVEVVRLR